MTEVLDIFISYRRKGGFVTAKHLNDLLIRDGYTVSFDIDTLREGRFDDALLKRIDQCSDFLLIVDEHAFDRTLDPNFNPQKDWLRMELAYAIRIKKNIIPILLSGVEEFPADLPDDISEVSKYHSPKYQMEYFDNFYQKLKEFLHSTPRHLKNNDKATVTFNSEIETIIFVDGEETSKVQADGFAKISLPLGEHIFLYKSISNNSSYYNETITLDSKRNYVVEIKAWKFKKKTFLRPLIFLFFLLSLVCVIMGINYYNGNIEERILQDSITKSVNPVVFVVDSLITKNTIGELPYLYTGSVDEKCLPHGKGVAKFKDDKGKYEGSFRHGVIEGDGVHFLTNGDVFRGTFLDNQYEEGEYIWKKGGFFRGTFKNGTLYTGNYFNSLNELKRVYDKGNCTIIK